MSVFKYFQVVFSNFLHGFHFLGKIDLEQKSADFDKEIFSLKASNAQLEFEINQLRKALIDLYYEVNKDEAGKYSHELSFLHSQRDITMFPYEKETHRSSPIYTEFDQQKGLPFVFHKNKRLYFPKEWSIDKVEETYRYFMETECLTAVDKGFKRPHQYQSGPFKIEEGDVLLDVGCAEGLVALDAIEIVKKVILFESDSIWEAPLKATFEPYKEKVEIINKLVGDKDDNATTTLSSFSRTLGEEETFFVKMDIEGAEEKVVKGNADFFKKKKIKVACCTYHRDEHFSNLSTIFENWGYSVTPSDGYILCFLDGVFKPPFFRKGLIRASNIK